MSSVMFHAQNRYITITPPINIFTATALNIFEDYASTQTSILYSNPSGITTIVSQPDFVSTEILGGTDLHVWITDNPLITARSGTIVLHCNNGADDIELLVNQKKHLLKIGDIYGGGIVGYLLLPEDSQYDPEIQHGIIAAANDISSSGTYWWNGEYITTNATNYFIGGAASNTLAIVATQGDGTYAAKLCNDLIINSYTDWYLPTYVDLFNIWKNRALIGNFTESRYWSSTEERGVDDPPGGATLASYYGTPNDYVPKQKSNRFKVRPIRYF